MIIGYDGSRAFINKRTGTENYAFQLLHNISLVDHNNTYYVYTRNLASKGQAFTGLGKHNDNYKWPNNFKFIKIHYPRLWTQVGLAAQTFKDPLDLLFVPSHTLPIIRRPGLKTVLTVHDLGAEYLPASHQLKQRLYLDFMTHYQLKSATHLIAVSEATKTDIIKRVGVDPKSITAIYEGFNSQLFGHEISISRLTKDLLEFNLVPDWYFLFVGTIQPRKNLIRLIKAYALYLNNELRIKNYGKSTKPIIHDSSFIIPDLVLAGGKGWLSDEIYKLPEKLGIESRVKFLGYVPDEKLPALYQGAKAFLFPSLFEGFGLPVLEAFASGTPVITSKVSSLPEVAGDAAILVDPYSTKELSQAFLEVLKPLLKRSLVNKGYQQVKQFSWQKAAIETIKVFEEVASSK